MSFTIGLFDSDSVFCGDVNADRIYINLETVWDKMIYIQDMIFNSGNITDEFRNLTGTITDSGILISETYDSVSIARDIGPEHIIDSTDPFEDGSLMSKYQFNDTTDLGLDTTGTHNGSNVGVVADEDSHFLVGGCGYFAGVDDRISIPTSSVGSNIYSYSVWVKPTTTGVVNDYIIDFTTGRGILSNGTTTDATLCVYSGAAWTYSGHTLSTTEWTHVVLASYGTGFKLYVNGTEIQDQTITMSAISGAWEIGADYNGTGSEFVGYIDQVEIYTKVLSADEVDYLFNQSIPSSQVLKGIGNTTENNFEIDYEFANISTSYGELSTIKATPNMTSDYLPSGVVSASASYSSPYLAFNGDNENTGDDWRPPTSTITGWLQYEFPSPLIIGAYTISNSATSDAGPKDWTIQGSNTGLFTGEETVLDIQVDQIVTTAYTDYNTYNLQYNDIAFKFYRIDITANNGSVNYLQIAHMIYFERLASIPDKLVTNNPIQNGDKLSIINNNTVHKIEASSVVAGANNPNVRYIRDSINGSSANTANHWSEIQAFERHSGVNRALSSNGSTISGSAEENSSYPYSRIIDGNLDSLIYATTATTGLQYVTIDLQAEYDIDTINVQHYNVDSRTYNETKTEVSLNNVDWVTIYDSAVNGTYRENDPGMNFQVPRLSVPYTMDTASITNGDIPDAVFFTGVDASFAVDGVDSPMEYVEDGTFTEGVSQVYSRYDDGIIEWYNDDSLKITNK